MYIKIINIIKIVNIIIDDMDFSPYIIDEKIADIIASKACDILAVKAPLYYEELSNKTMGRCRILGGMNVIQINECASPSNIAELYKSDKDSAVFFFEKMCDTILHEYRHAYQTKTGMFDTCEYKKATKDYNEYYNQGCEVDAREWASKIWKENGAQLLGAIFNFLEDLYLDLLEDGWE